jgi:hypothetical protein
MKKQSHLRRIQDCVMQTYCKGGRQVTCQHTCIFPDHCQSLGSSSIEKCIVHLQRHKTILEDCIQETVATSVKRVSLCVESACSIHVWWKSVMKSKQWVPCSKWCQDRDKLKITAPAQNICCNIVYGTCPLWEIVFFSSYYSPGGVMQNI